MNDNFLKGVQSQEEDSLVKAPRNEEPATGNRIRECEQNFGTLETEVQFTRFCKQAAFIHKVAVGEYYRTGLYVDDGFGVRTPACRYTGLRADSLLLFDKEHYFDQFFKIILSSVLVFMELTFRDHPRLHLRGRHGYSFAEDRTASWKGYLISNQDPIPQVRNHFERELLQKKTKLLLQS